MSPERRSRRSVRRSPTPGTSRTLLRLSRSSRRSAGGFSRVLGFACEGTAAQSRRLLPLFLARSHLVFIKRPQSDSSGDRGTSPSPGPPNGLLESRPQAVTTGAYRAVEFIKKNIKLDTEEKASVEDSKKVVEICTKYAQKGMFNIFLVVFFTTLSFAFLEPFFFVGYLISIALFGLYQAIFMANAGGAWDNAKKVVETELHAKGPPLHDACVIGDTVGDPFKDTSSVALNPIIKFTTLFGLLAVNLAVDLTAKQGASLATGLAVVFSAVSVVFVYRSFYGMRIESKD